MRIRLGGTLAFAALFTHASLAEAQGGHPQSTSARYARADAFLPWNAQALSLIHI